MSAAMRAIRLHEYGELDGLRFEEVPIPKPDEGEVLVQVHAAGVNPVDWKIACGELKEMFEVDRPYTLGEDVSGVVVTVGSGVTGLSEGDEVFGMIPANRGGAFAAYAVLKADEVAPKPRSMSHKEAASLPLTSLTAWQALNDAARLREGQYVLIHAASGGVGSAAVQLAKIIGARVTGTASGEHKALITSLGANCFVNYQVQDFAEVVSDVDVVLDTIGGDTLARSMEVLKPGGFLVSLVEEPSREELDRRNLQGMFILTRPDGKQLRKIAEWADDGRLLAHVERTYPLAEAVDALTRSRDGHVGGKLVLRPYHTDLTSSKHLEEE
jgi:NADPH:quinone reductase-like Zn-dependent oxidoreductase